ncbi:Membrane protein involved in the export of O-antigen and teichoic acid [Sphingomonas gellani]|uniref:Membrane protein involved in the export of O-antigen and teichoic acid n=1 Tax=Sphingomonas gellani TaxID=1166340 RepID=A0A1H7YJU5_9SPHN|nr:oligosaccharide flippase family protein [Sphingomonas gellani]SEM45598.1 Membrane protein involved in the export of O-antigen and teichoic acid [Sphingomonas gellani]
MSVRIAALWSVTGQWLVFVLNFAVSVILARYLLPPSAVGTYSVGFAAAAMISTLQDFGLSRFLLRSEELTDQMIATCTTITLCVGAAICAVIAGLSLPAAWYYQNTQLVPIMVLIGGAFLLLPLNVVPVALLQRAVDFRTLSLVGLCAAAANGVVSILFAWRGYGPVALALGFFAQQAVRGVTAALLSPRGMRWTPSFKGARPVISFGGGTTVLAISGALGTRSPDLIIGRVLGMRAVGLFGRAAGMVDGLRTLLDGGISSVFYSHFAQLIRTKRRLDGVYLDLVACYTSIMWPAMILLSLLATPIVTLVYGTGWREAADAMRWVALSELVFFALPLHTEVPLLSGHLKELLVRNVLDTAAALICLLCLVRFGLEAAAIARLVYGGIWFFIYLGMMRRIVGFARTALFATHARSGLCTLAACLPAAVFSHGGTILTISIAVGSMIVGAGLWLVALALLRHPTWRELERGVEMIRPYLPRRATI